MSLDDVAGRDPSAPTRGDRMIDDPAALAEAAVVWRRIRARRLAAEQEAATEQPFSGSIQSYASGKRESAVAS